MAPARFGGRILPLAERPDLLDLVARWTFGEWGHLNAGQTLAGRVARVRAGMNVDAVPSIVVALEADGRVVGTATLMDDDLEGDPRNPWLASVYVPPEERGRGVASALVRAIEGLAARLGHRRLYLFTASAPALYAGLGWRTLESRDYRGERITVMDRDLGAD